jgi:hypothetical protein
MIRNLTIRLSGKQLPAVFVKLTVVKNMAKFRTLFAAEFANMVADVSLLDIDCRFEAHLIFTAEVGG